MSNLKITTGVNFEFIQDSFIEAKLALMEENKTGVIDNTRLKGIGLEGASRTGKTWDICVFICHYVKQYKGKRINICRDWFANIKDSIYSTLKTVWGLFGYPIDYFKQTVRDIHYKSNIISFIGINNNPMKAHGLESDILVINEAMGVSKESSKQMMQRTNEFYIFDYNPSAIDSWVFDLEARSDYKMFHTTIFDNDYAPANAKSEILLSAHPICDDYHVVGNHGYSKEEWKAFKEKNVKLKTADRLHWEVYGLGLRSVSDDTIFQGVETYIKEPAKYDWKLFGGDFGYKNDPTALVEITKVGYSLYLRCRILKTGLLNNNIAEKIVGTPLNDELSVWDTAEEKSIDELRMHGVNATYADKGFKIFGIQKMQQFNIYIYYEDIEMLNEFRKYRWLKDRNGDYKRNTHGHRIPSDLNDHTIDATRYGLMYYSEAITKNGN